MIARRKAVVIFLCLSVLTIILSSSVYVAVEAHHHCTGTDDCPICHELLICEQFIHTVEPAAAAAAICSMPVISFLLLVADYSRSAQAITLISLKVKLSD